MTICVYKKLSDYISNIVYLILGSTKRTTSRSAILKKVRCDIVIPVYFTNYLVIPYGILIHFLKNWQSICILVHDLNYSSWMMYLFCFKREVEKVI